VRALSFLVGSTLGQTGAVDKVPEIKRQGRFQARKKMPFGITLSI